ncbi:unnamed protein product [Fusarium venenatum]|uniref:Uncharacterized protein n=1 Tax=Fusarium venenatum TaxID=56646 RepID=A0A2L2TXY2_9HYPO|nr:uncharacterized protein FVRRES_02197 [Fusarium venenatum]CEI65685.1 unnamed protein product [Fusarium venenatum]
MGNSLAESDKEKVDSDRVRVQHSTTAHNNNSNIETYGVADGDTYRGCTAPGHLGSGLFQQLS